MTRKTQPGTNWRVFWQSTTLLSSSSKAPGKATGSVSDRTHVRSLARRKSKWTIGGCGALRRCGCARTYEGTQFLCVKFRLGSAGEPTICSHCYDVLNEDYDYTEARSQEPALQQLCNVNTDRSTSCTVTSMQQHHVALIAQGPENSTTWVTHLLALWPRSPWQCQWRPSCAPCPVHGCRSSQSPKTHHAPEREVQDCYLLRIFCIKNWLSSLHEKYCRTAEVRSKAWN